MKLRNSCPWLTLLVLTTFAGGCATDSLRPAAQSELIPSAGLAPMPEAVTSFGAVAHRGALYVFGGHRGERHEYNATDVSGSLHRLELSGGSGWEKLPVARPAQGVALVAYEGGIFRLGGMAAHNQKGEKQDLRSQALASRFDLKTGQWQDLPPLPKPRSSHDAAVVGHQLYVGGGWELPGGTNRGVWHNDMWALDLSRPGATWSSIPQPFKRRALAVAAFEGRLYFLGGMDGENKTSLAVDIYDPASGRWSTGPELPPGPMKGFGCAAVAQNGRLYYSGMKGELYQLAASGQRWELVGKLKHPRFFHRLVPLGGAQLLAAGGEDSEGKRNDLELITPARAPLTASAAP